MFKRICLVFLCLFLMLSFTACNEIPLQKTYSKDLETQIKNDSFIAENDSYRLEFNTKNCGVKLVDLNSGKSFGTSPEEKGVVEYDEFGLPKERSYQVESVFMLKYLEYVSNTEVTALSYDAVKAGNIVCKSIENGIRVEYYFDEIKIMIPVDFKLNDNYVTVSIDPTEIQENENKVVKISLAPYFCSSENDSRNSYLFIPSGSGAIMFPKTLTEPIKTFSGMVYGYDYSMEIPTVTSLEESIRLPVYGVKNDDAGVCAIIENGAESAYIDADVGDSTIGYSSVYTTFQLRGYTTHTSKQFSKNEVDSNIYCDNLIQSPISVRYYPLSGENADYVGMADIYRKYLIEKYGLADESSDISLNINILGGTMITKSFLGIPYNSLYKATTLNEASGIVADIFQNIDSDISLKLKGYGTSGVDVGEIGNGFKLSDKLGDKDDLDSLVDLCKKNNSDVYMDFDLMRYSKGGNGFSAYFSSVTNVAGQKAYQYLFDKAVKDKQEESMYYILSPEKFNDAAERLVKKTQKYSMQGYSLDTFSTILYSDYKAKDSAKYYSRSGSAESVTKAIKYIVKETDSKFMATKANDYAAAISDVVTDIPTSSTGSYIFDYDIPFYALVFKGYIPITTESINLSSNSNELLLKAVESGCGLNYTVTQRWDNSLIDANYPYFYNSVYENVKDRIISDYSKLSDYYDKILGAHIAEHAVLEENLRKTEFDNGIIVYVNYGDSSASTPDGEIGAHDYLVLESLS